MKMTQEYYKVRLKLLLSAIDDEDYKMKDIEEIISIENNKKEYVDYLQTLKNDTLVAQLSFVKVDINKFCECETRYKLIKEALEILYLFV